MGDRMTFPASLSAGKERRLLGFRSNLGRLVDQTSREYVPRTGDGLLDGSAKLVGAGLNILTTLPETLLRDLARWIDRRKEPLSPLPHGYFARTRENIGEILGVFKNPGSAIANTLQIPGSVGMDLYDGLLLGNMHDSGVQSISMGTRNNVRRTIAPPPSRKRTIRAQETSYALGV
jgi:hypothetical protein